MTEARPFDHVPVGMADDADALLVVVHRRIDVPVAIGVTTG